MKLFIPACGDRIKLTASWEFDLHLEHRNTKFAAEHGLLDQKEVEKWGYYGVRVDPNARWPDPNYGKLKVERFLLTEGTILECDRVYIRATSKGRNEDNNYDSITWKVIGKNNKMMPNQRFWCKLHDTSDMEYEVVSLQRDRV
jgi:hypothetical protein